MVNAKVNYITGIEQDAKDADRKTLFYWAGVLGQMRKLWHLAECKG